MASASTAPRIMLLADAMFTGGGQMVYLRRAQWLHRNGYFTVFAGGEGELLDQVADAGIPTLRLEPLGAQGQYVTEWRRWGETIQSLLDFVDEHKITVVNAQPIVPVLAARELARLRPIGLHCDFLATQTHIVPTGPYIDEVLRGTFSLPSGPCQEELERRLYIPRKHLRSLELGLDTGYFATRPTTTIRDALQISPDQLLVANISRQDHDKIANIYAFVDALEPLMREYEHLNALFVGNGSEHDRLVEYATQRLDFARTNFLDVQSDLRPIYHGVDAIFAVGSVAYEAACARVPIVIGSANAAELHDHSRHPRDQYSIGYYAEYDFHTTGDSAPGVRYSSIEERLRPLVEDKTERERIGTRGFKRVTAEHDLDITMPAWVARYEDLHARRAARVPVTPQPWAPRVVVSDRPSQLRVAIAPPHDPGSITAPWERWSTLLDPLRKYGVDADLVLAPCNDFNGYDAIVAPDPQAGSTITRWPHMAAAGAKLFLAGPFDDTRPLRALVSYVQFASAHNALDCETLLHGLRSRTLAVPGIHPLDLLDATGNPEAAVAERVSASTRYLAASEREAQLLESLPGVNMRWSVLPPFDEQYPEGNAARFHEEHGMEDFTLCLGTITPEHNQAVVALASERPVVLLGAPDMHYHFRCLALARADLKIIGNADAQTCADALAAASVVVNVALIDRDPHLLRQAARSSTPLVVSRFIDATAAGHVERCDPLDPGDVRCAINRALAAGPQLAREQQPLATADRRARLLARQLYADCRQGRGPASLYDASYVIVINTLDALQQVLLAIGSADGAEDIEYIFVDNATDDGARDLLGQLEGDVQVVRAEARCSISQCHQLGVDRAQSECVRMFDVGNADEVRSLVSQLHTSSRDAAAA